MTQEANPNGESDRAVDVKRLALLVLGALLAVPFVGALALELGVLARVTFAGETPDSGTELAIGGLLMAFTAPFAIGGLALWKKGRRGRKGLSPAAIGWMAAAAAAIVAAWIFLIG